MSATMDLRDVRDARPGPTPGTGARERDPALRRKLRRFAGFLLVAVVALIGLTVAYVQLFDRVLRDPERPPTVTSPTNPRVFLFELVFGAAVVVFATLFFALRRRKGPR
jgi:hypothetical protein